MKKLCFALGRKNMWEDIIRDSERIQALEKVKTDNVVSYRGILKYLMFVPFCLYFQRRVCRVCPIFIDFKMEISEYSISG